MDSPSATPDFAPAMTPAQREAAKTPVQRRDDIAYTINHTIVCGLTDFIDPFLANWSQKNIGKDLHVSAHEWLPWNREEHRHGNGKSHLREWIAGEAIGDIGAVPVAIAMQRFAPGFMAHLASLGEPVLGPLFRRGAERAAAIWAKENHVLIGSREYREQRDAIYRHEIDHLPQAAIWTAAAIGLNIVTQKHLLPAMTEGKWINEGSYGRLLFDKSLGSTASAGALVGFRSLSPRLARKWDGWTNEHIFKPTTHVIGVMAGQAESAPELSSPYAASIASGVHVFTPLGDHSPIERVEADHTGTTAIIALYPKEGQTPALAQLPGSFAHRVLSQPGAGHPPTPLVIACQGPPEAALHRLSLALETRFKATPKMEGTHALDLMKVRGVLGNIGQLLIVASGIQRRSFEDGALMKSASAGSSFVANLINMLYGEQKKDDPEALRQAKEKINTELGALLPDASSLPAPDAHLNPPAPTSLNKTLSEHSTVISDAIKFVSKGLLAFSGRKDEKPLRQWSGYLSQSAKVMTMIGKEPGEMPPQPPLSKPLDCAGWFVEYIRQHAMAFSGITELNATALLLPDSFPKGNKADWLQAIGTSFLMVGLLCKSMASFSVKTVDMDELYSHAAAALSALPAPLQQEHLHEIATGIKRVEGNEHTPLASIYAELLGRMPLKQELEKVGTPDNAIATSPYNPLTPERLVPAPQRFF